MGAEFVDDHPEIGQRAGSVTVPVHRRGTSGG
jgi:hypothetical protein